MNKIALTLVLLWFSPYLSGGDSIAYSPKKSQMKFWEPYAWELGTSVSESVEKRLTSDNTQGYTLVRRYKDSTSNAGLTDDNADGCDRPSFDAFSRVTGIALVDSHGSSNHFSAMSFATEPLAKKWVEVDGSGGGGLDTPGFGYRKVIEKNKWDIYATDSWIKENWWPFMKDNRAIVLMIWCNSFKGKTFPNFGARLGFGYSDCTVSSENTKDMTILFDRMNGSRLENGERKRIAGDAFKETGFSKNFEIGGEKHTTLCPAVSRDKKGKHLIKPQAGETVAAKRLPDGSVIIEGFITFDTHIDKTNLDTDAKVAQVISVLFVNENGFGTGHVKKAKWADGGDTKIEFELDVRNCTPGKLKLQVDATKIMSEGGGGQRLDGGDIRDDPTNPSGIAPNANGPADDHFKWIFTYTNTN